MFNTLVKCGVVMPRKVAISSPGSNGEAIVKAGRNFLRRGICEECTRGEFARIIAGEFAEWVIQR